MVTSPRAHSDALPAFLQSEPWVAVYGLASLVSIVALAHRWECVATARELVVIAGHMYAPNALPLSCPERHKCESCCTILLGAKHQRSRADTVVVVMRK
jgi:hypothetical protein